MPSTAAPPTCSVANTSLRSRRQRRLTLNRRPRPSAPGPLYLTASQLGTLPPRAVIRTALSGALKSSREGSYPSLDNAATDELALSHSDEYRPAPELQRPRTEEWHEDEDGAKQLRRTETAEQSHRTGRTASQGRQPEEQIPGG
jgi:hypothetical protein